MAVQCWNWVGAFDTKGYPRFWYKGNAVYANRLKYLLEGIPIGPDDHVVTLCQNRQCVRPEHHVLGTDKEVRLFGVGGYRGPGDLYFARKLYADGEIDLDTLAFAYEISADIVNAIIFEGGQ